MYINQIISIKLVSLILMFALIICTETFSFEQPELVFRDTEELAYTHAKYSDNGNYLLLYDLSLVKVWDVQSGKLLSEYRVPQPQSFYIQDAAISPNGEFVAVGGFTPNLVVLLDARTGEVFEELKTEVVSDVPHWFQIIGGLAFSIDNKYLFAGAYPGLVYWDLLTKEYHHLLSFGSKIIKMFPDGKKLMLHGSITSIIAFPSGEVLQESYIGWPVILNNGASLRGLDGIIDGVVGKYRVFDLDTERGAVIQQYEPFFAGERDTFEFSADGSVLISRSSIDAKAVILRDGQTGRVLKQVERAAAKQVSAQVFSPDGRKLAVIHENEVVIYDVAKSLSSAVIGAELAK